MKTILKDAHKTAKNEVSFKIEENYLKRHPNIANTEVSIKIALFYLEGHLSFVILS